MYDSIVAVQLWAERRYFEALSGNPGILAFRWRIFERATRLLELAAMRTVETSPLLESGAPDSPVRTTRPGAGS